MVDTYTPPQRERLLGIAAGSAPSLFNELMAKLVARLVLPLTVAIAVPLVLLFLLGMDGDDVSPSGMAVAFASAGPTIVLALLLGFGPISRSAEANLDDQYRLAVLDEEPVDASIIAKSRRRAYLMLLIPIGITLIFAAAIYILLQPK